MNYLREVLRARELLANLTLRDIRGQYKRTIFGQLWSLLNPLAAMLIYTVVFRFIIRVDPAPGNPSGLDVFPLWLLCALLPWSFFSSAVTSGMGSLMNNAGLVQKVYFTRVVLPVSSIGAVAFNWLFEMGVLAVALLIAGGATGWHLLPWLPLVIVFMALLAVFAGGLALILSVANVHFRDTQYLMGIVFQIWMYLTPIIYPVSLVQDQSDRLGGLFGTRITLLNLYQLNPMDRFVSVFRNLMYDQRLPNANDVIACILFAAVSIVIGVWVFRTNEKGLAEAL